MSAHALAIRSFRGLGHRKVSFHQLQHRLTANPRRSLLHNIPVTSKARSNAPWRQDKTAAKVASRTWEQADERRWSQREDTAFRTEEDTSVTGRLQQLLSSPYDAEIFAILIPALLATLLDPVMVLIDTGKRTACIHQLIVLAVLLANYSMQGNDLQALLAG